MHETICLKLGFFLIKKNHNDLKSYVKNKKDVLSEQVVHIRTI